MKMNKNAPAKSERQDTANSQRDLDQNAEQKNEFAQDSDSERKNNMNNAPGQADKFGSNQGAAENESEDEADDDLETDTDASESEDDDQNENADASSDTQAQKPGMRNAGQSSKSNEGRPQQR